MPTMKNKKVCFMEQDAAKLTERYDATTVLTLLQEVSLYPKAKIDWNELVKKTSTAISNAREYQMLWRHLAYHDALIDNLEEGAEPLDDESDLECEVEASPPTSAESASEVAACVKVMIASCSLSESTPSSSTIEAPLTINVPVCHSSRTPNESSQSSNLMQGKSIIFPVTVQRQTLPTVSSTERIETKGLDGGNVASKRKRIGWSEEEDKQLRAAVQRWGEGNWVAMAKEENFPIKRSHTQLSQRWNALRKKDGGANSGSILTSTTPYTTAEQRAAWNSVSHAVGTPFRKLTATGTTNPARTSFDTSTKSQVQPIKALAAVHSNFVPAQHTSQPSGFSGSSAKSNVVPEKPLSKANSILNPAIKATAIAVGARIVSPSDTVLQPKVAHAKNAVPTNSSLPKVAQAKNAMPTNNSLPKVSQANNAVPANSSLGKSSTSTSLPSESKVQICIGSSATPVRTQSVVAITSPTSYSSTGKSVSAITLSILQGKHVTSVVKEIQETQIKQEVNRVSDPSPAQQKMVQNKKLEEEKNVIVKDEAATLNKEDANLLQKC